RAKAREHKQQLKKLEDEIAAVEARIEALEQLQYTDEVVLDHVRAQEVQRELESERRHAETLYDRYLQFSLDNPD
ncbi:MAG: ABC transporter C-terminal domain-containing protein, partial [Bacillota bacterium]|nr:ABC transporter C-terminal domain-containing protein [Bacillota bacterium]